VIDREALERTLGHRFRDPALLDRALTHRSRSHEEGTGGGSYERLEFLGDSLLGFLVADWLMDSHPEADEGELTRRKQAIVSTGPLAQAARELGLGEALRLGRGEEETGGRDKTSLLADVFEAVLAAVYQDGGMRKARAFVRRHLKGRVASVRRGPETADDAKTRLQEQVQARLRLTPTYRIVRTAGPAHARSFTAEVVVGERVVGEGTGPSRKQAEQEAARAALREWA
jgi:ribonuclease-3